MINRTHLWFSDRWIKLVHRSKWENVQIQVFAKHNVGNSTPPEEGKVRSTFIHSEGEEGDDLLKM